MIRENDRDMPPGNWVDTSAGGEHEPGSVAAGGTPGSGANLINRAGLPNADPDGYDEDRTDLEGVDLGGVRQPISEEGPIP